MKLFRFLFETPLWENKCPDPMELSIFKDFSG